MNTITSMPFRTLAAGAIFSALAMSFAGASSADETGTPPQIIVKYADLNPLSAQGAAILYERIHGAAGDVCSRMYPIAEAYRWHKEACLQKLIADTVSKVDSPALSAVFASKYGISAPVVLAATGAR